MSIILEEASAPPSAQRKALTWIWTGAIVFGVVTLAGAVVGISLLKQNDFSHAYNGSIVLFTTLLVLTGFVGVAVMLAAWIVWGQLNDLLNRVRLMEQQTAALVEQRAVAPSSAPTASLDGAETRRLLADIREILLLPESQRQTRFEAMVSREVRRRLELADRYIDSRDFHRAREELAQVVERFGRNDDHAHTESRLAATMKAALTEDVETTTRKVADFMGMTHWEKAEQYAIELIQKYPDAAEPKRLLDRVREERTLFDQKHRQRMHEEIQKSVTQRRWREAAVAAAQFIQTFPKGPDTDALRQQIDTLNANAEIEIRQQLERHIKEYIARKNYWDALGLARRIIAEYPFSPQASALRLQLPRLEELARQQGPRG